MAGGPITPAAMPEGFAIGMKGADGHGYSIAQTEPVAKPSRASADAEAEASRGGGGYMTNPAACADFLRSVPTPCGTKTRHGTPKPGTGWVGSVVRLRSNEP